MESIITVMNSVFDALKHNPFGAASLLVAVTVLLVFQWWRQRKIFSYKIISDYSLFNVDKQFSDRVKILFDDKPVGRVSLIVIEFRNSGWVPIEDKDFFKSVEVSFGQESEIMSIETDETRPKDMGISAVVSGSKFVIEPTLFNRRDFVRLKALVHGYKGQIAVSGRIKGVPKIKREDLGFRPVVIVIIMFFGGAISNYIASTLQSSPVSKTVSIISAFLISLVFGLLLARKLTDARPSKIRIYED